MNVTQQADYSFRPAKEEDSFQYELPGPGAVVNLKDPIPDSDFAKKGDKFVVIDPPIKQFIYRNPNRRGNPEFHLVHEFPPAAANLFHSDGTTDPKNLREIIQREAEAREWKIGDALSGVLFSRPA